MDMNLIHQQFQGRQSGVGIKLATNNSLNIELQSDGRYIQWRYKGFPKWNNLISIKDLKGSDGKNGLNGVDGKNGLNGIQGTPGINGTDGKDGANGSDGEPGKVGNPGKDGRDGKDGENGLDGDDGREIELRKSNTHIQWRYVGEALWRNLIALSDLKGEKGDPGKDGKDGRDGMDGKKGRDGYDGAPGKNGAPGYNGIDGVPGPNLISEDTNTGLSGFIKGNGEKVYVDDSVYIEADGSNSNIDKLTFDATPSTDALVAGQMRYNTTDETLDFYNGKTTQQIGQELFIKVHNRTGAMIPNGTPVYFDGRQGNRPKIWLAKADSEATSRVMGLTTEDIADQSDGFITTFGYVRQIKTNYSGSGFWGTTWQEGDKLCVSKDVAGQLTNVEPTAPHHSDCVGVVGVIGGSGIGSIEVNLQRHVTLEELADVDGTPLTTSGQLPNWNNINKYFDFDKNINDYLPIATAGSTFLKLDQSSPQTMTNSPYFTAFTANTLVASNANKQLQSLQTSAYPSLTELTYLKGVTSAIQTQINGKVAKSGDTMTGKLIITLPNSEVRGIDITNTDYTGASSLSAISNVISTAAGALSAGMLHTGITNTITDNRVVSTGGGPIAGTGNTGLVNSITKNVKHTGSPAVIIEENTGITNTVTRGGTHTSNPGAGTQFTNAGIINTVVDNNNINNASATLSINNYGMKSTIAANNTAPTGTLSRANYGIQCLISGNGTATANFGLQSAISNTGATKSYGIHSVQQGTVALLNVINGKTYFGTTNTDATAQAHFAAGTASAGSAPIKLTTGTLMTNPEAGAIEFLTDKIYFTIGTGTARKEITLNDIALTSGRIAYGTTNGRRTDSANFLYDGTTFSNLSTTKLGSSTNYANVSTAGRLSYVGTARKEWTKYTAASVTVTVGTSTSNVSTLQTMADGNFFDLTEAAATPGIDMYVEFTSVTAFEICRVLGVYEGSGTHAVAVQLYNWNTSAWDTFNAMQNDVGDVTTAGGYIVGNYQFTVFDDTNYIGTSANAGKVRVRFYHTMAGNVSHHLYLDEVSLRK